jgi:hypothetical protein
LDVTVGGAVPFEFVAGCEATAVILTCPTCVTPEVAVVGTWPGAVYTPTSWLSADGTILPTVASSPPEIPFTSQVIVVVVETVELAKLTTAVNSVVVLSGTVIAAGVIATEVTVDEEPPPQACKLQPPAITRAIIATNRVNGDR